LVLRHKVVYKRTRLDPRDKAVSKRQGLIFETGLDLKEQGLSTREQGWI